jgi:hypothetical protein
MYLVEENKPNQAEIKQQAPRKLDNRDAAFFERKQQIQWLSIPELQLQYLCPRRFWQHSSKLKKPFLRTGWHTIDRTRPRLFVSDTQLDALKLVILPQIPVEKLDVTGFPILACSQWICEGDPKTDINAGYVFYDIVLGHSLYLKNLEQLIAVYGLGSVSAAKPQIRRWEDVKAYAAPLPRAAPLLAGSAVFDDPVYIEIYDYLTDLLTDIRLHQYPDVEPLLRFLSKCNPKVDLEDVFQKCLEMKPPALLAEDVTEIDSLLERYKQQYSDQQHFEAMFHLETDRDAQRLERETFRYFKNVPDLAVIPKQYGPNEEWSSFDISAVAKKFKSAKLRGRSSWYDIVQDNHDPPRNVQELRRITRHWFNGPGKIKLEAKAEGNQATRFAVELQPCRLCSKKRVIYASASPQERSDFKCGADIAVNDADCGDDDEHLIHNRHCKLPRNSTQPCARKHYQWVIVEVPKTKGGKRVSYVQ